MLSTQIRKANQLLRQKDYDESIREYQAAERIKEGSDLFLDAIVASLKGYNHFCLLEYQQAENCYNRALEKSPFDSTTLMRRASLYMKMKKYDKAAFDVLRLYQMEPESIRVAALLMQLKQKGYQSWKQQSERDPFRKQQESDIELDEEEALNFSNVKMIDRISEKTPKHGRVSQINFRQDQRIEYQQFVPSSREDSKISKEMTRDKYELQELELNSVHSEEPQQLKFVTSKTPKKPKKSILKCSIAYRLPPQDICEKDTIITAPPLDVLKVKDIDGKTISSSRSIRFSIIRNSETSKPTGGSKPRKSCMKNVSMVVNPGSKLISKPQNANPRFSFGELRNADGKMSLQKKPSFKPSDGSSGDQSDQYNIYGNKDPQELSQELRRIKSYVRPQTNESTFGQSSLKPKKSILKPKNQSTILKQNGTKKSVLFK